jgi:hypothetical protein
MGLANAGILQTAVYVVAVTMNLPLIFLASPTRMLDGTLSSSDWSRVYFDSVAHHSHGKRGGFNFGVI